MKAGMDVELPMPVCYSGEMKEYFEEGKEDTAVLDRAVLRVLEADETENRAAVTEGNDQENQPHVMGLKIVRQIIKALEATWNF